MDAMAYWRDYSHDESRKLRCVARHLIYIDEKQDDAKLRYAQRANISGSSFARYWRMKSKLVATREDRQRITANFRYLWDHGRAPYREGRFNREDYPALYTARDTSTAKAERFHYIDEGSKDFDYVVYSMSAEAKVADLRPHEDVGRLAMTDDHRPCRSIADKVRHLRDGIAWYSVRLKGGACCVFFTCDAMEALQIEEEGTHSPVRRT